MNRLMKNPILSDIAHAMWNQIEALSNEQLDAVIKEADSLTKMNCGWQAYAVSAAAREFAKTIKRKRTAYWFEFGV